MSNTLKEIGRNSADLYVRNLIAAEQAVFRGEFNNAKVLRALAYSHRTVAMNAYRGSEETISAKQAFSESILCASEIQDIQDAFKLQNEHIATQQSAIAEKAQKAISDADDVPEWIIPQLIFTCNSCGLIVEGQKPEVCPTCSALSSEFELHGPFFASDAEHLGQQTPDSVIDILNKAVDEISDATASVDDATMTRKPSPTEWSIKEIIGHIIETDVLFLRRIDSLLTGSVYKQPVPPWKLHEGKDYNQKHRDDLIKLLTETRRLTSSRIKNLTPKEWATTALLLGGKRSVLDTGTWIALHDIGHIEQIKRLAKK